MPCVTCRALQEAHVQEFSTWLSVERRVAASTQNQALNAVVFLYDKVLDQALGGIGHVVRAQRRGRLPTVLSHGEAMAVSSARRPLSR
ncbi:phage integrase N-terminal SAM-like domain-containing protein [Aquisalimonas sp.]|uniref:phage integrase N-terminal SAM-like domain-containing protein n=1 Tax=Aquisalimonas sp. TaxID=1872621 RepID=UPI0025BC01C4|nr:phage integrase N-terminal SAM-like domain-containing protein [Aquisalimonas sp.]